MPQFELTLLGDFALAVEGAALVAPPQICQLIALIALSKRRALSRDEIAAELWGDSAEDSAKHNIRACLSHMRKLFRLKARRPLSDLIACDRTHVRLVEDNAGIDIDQFRANAAAGLARNDERLLGAAVAAYRGDLTTVLDLEWVRYERTQLSALHSACVSRLFECAAARDAFDDAIRWGNLLLAIDPYDEAVTAQLMTVLYRQGRRVKAIELFRGLSHRLRHDYGIAPSSRVRGHFEAIAADNIAQLSRAAPGGTPE